MTEHDGLQIWTASESGGEPVCVSDDTDAEGSLSVSLYRDDEGVIRGIEIWEKDGTGVVMDLIGLAGKFPTAMLEELTGERSIWHHADTVMNAYLDSEESNA